MLGATYISYRDMQTTQKLQYVLVSFQVLVLLFFADRRDRRRRSTAAASTPRRSTSAWFNPFAVELVQRVRRGPVAVDLHLLGLGCHPHDERGDEGPREDAGPRRDAHGHHDRLAVPAARGRDDHVRRASARASWASATKTSRRTCSSTCPARSSARSPSWCRSRCSRARRRRCSRRSSARPARCCRWGTTARCRRRSRRSARGSSLPGYATIVSAVVASAFYAVMRIVSERRPVGHDPHARHDDLLLLRHHRVRVRVVLPQAVVRLGAQRLLHVPVPARRRRDPRGAVRHDADRLDGPGLRQRIERSAASASCSSSAC